MNDDLGGKDVRSVDSSPDVSDTSSDVGDTSDDISEDITESGEDDISDGGSTDTAEDIAEDSPEESSIDTPEDIPEDVSEDVSEDTSSDTEKGSSEVNEDVADIPEDSEQPSEQSEEAQDEELIPPVAERPNEPIDNTADKLFEEYPFKEDGTLKENIKYKAGEFDYNYETDDQGRITNFHTDNLQLTDREDRLSHDSDTPGKEEGDHAGHLAGDRFGGSPEIDNLVSQSSDVNLSQYKKIENEWADAIKNGQSVKANVDVNYEGGALRPSEFLVKYEVDGERSLEIILNRHSTDD